MSKTDEAIEMPFALITRVGPRKDLLHIADRFVANVVLCSDGYLVTVRINSKSFHWARSVEETYPHFRQRPMSYID